jgi:hypothetical protein
VIGDGQQTVHIRGQVDASNIRALVDDYIKESGILVGKAVVVLAPHGGGDQEIQGSDRITPGEMAAHLQPFRVLVEHGIDDVHEGFIG